LVTLQTRVHKRAIRGDHLQHNNQLNSKNTSPPGLQTFLRWNCSTINHRNIFSNIYQQTVISKYFHWKVVLVFVGEIMFTLALLVALLSIVSGLENIVQIRRLGFDQDPKTFSHEVIIPWARPFKPGYCESWEWHTDERYRQRRTEICKNLSGSK